MITTSSVNYTLSSNCSLKVFVNFQRHSGEVFLLKWITMILNYSLIFISNIVKYLYYFEIFPLTLRCFVVYKHSNKVKNVNTRITTQTCGTYKTNIILQIFKKKAVPSNYSMNMVEIVMYNCFEKKTFYFPIEWTKISTAN